MLFLFMNLCKVKIKTKIYLPSYKSNFKLSPRLHVYLKCCLKNTYLGNRFFLPQGCKNI